MLSGRTSTTATTHIQRENFTMRIDEVLLILVILIVLFKLCQ